MKVFALFSVLGLASAACPNNCAGHGTCGEATQCDCYRNWFGADCSKRICTYSAAFVDTPVGDLNGDGEHGPARYFDPRLNTKVYGIDFVGGGQSEMYSHNYGYARLSRTTPHDEAHFYRECANKGTCDRTTGACNCFPGYEGEGIFWRSFNQAANTAQKEQVYADRMPSAVHYTITFTDEYGDEHVTSLLSVEYKSICSTTVCLTYPDFKTQTLQEHAESVNQSLGALPRSAIENKYVWAVGTEYKTDGAAEEFTISGTGATAVKQKWMTYPKDWKKVKGADPLSVAVDQLEYRLDEEVIPAGCKGKDIKGTAAAQQYGLCLFVQIENPGVQQALKVQYFYNPKTTSTRALTLETEVVSGQTVGFNSKGIDETDVVPVTDPTYLVTVQDLQSDREWNSRDGDVSKLFISKSITKLAMCSKRGLCDYDTGMCDCFSGYSGIRCDDQNAIAYSY